MDSGKYFFVEHFVADKQGWDKLMSSWFDIFGKSMNCLD
jgi:hypothetical protein